MARKRPGRPAFRSHQMDALVEAIEQSARDGGVVHEWTSRLTAAQRRRFAAVGRRLDPGFLSEKVDLIQDTLVQILEHRSETPSPLLQRNLWSSIDAVAMHFDQVGFTPVIQAAASRVASRVRLDDPQLVGFESRLASIVMGGDGQMARLGIAPVEIPEVLQYAEKHKRQACGLPKLARKDFTMQHAVADFCGRPDQMFEVIIHSPQAAKVVIIVVLLIANVVAAVAGLLTLVGFLLGVVVAVVTAIVILIVGGCGC